VTEPLRRAVPETATLRFHLAVQSSRLAVMSLMAVVAGVGWLTGLLDFDARWAALAYGSGALSCGVFAALYRRAYAHGGAPPPHGAWMAADTLIICWTIWIMGDQYPLWLIWFLIHTTAAAFVAGRRAALVVMAASCAGYLATLTGMGRIAGFDQQLLWAIGRLTLLFGSTWFMVRGIADLREKRLQVAALHDEQSHQLEELRRLAAELDSRSRELAEANLRAQEANRAKSQFLANMSHELRTPLNSIIGFSEILAERLEGAIDPRFAKFLQNIVGSGKHLLALINDILDLSKIEAGKMELIFEPLSLGDLVRGVESVMHSIAAGRSIRLVSELPLDLPPLVADAPRIKQTLYNLASNAVKFSPAGSTVTIRARALSAAESPIGVPSAQLEVEDHGVGIRREDQRLIFDEFRQVDGRTTRNMGGTGLGLALVKRFVELHGGVVSVESEVGQGSLFRVVLPLDASAVEPRRGSGEPVSFGFELARAADALAESDGPLVLVAEDDGDFYASLAGDLRAAGYRVRRAARGDEALEMVALERPSAIVLDLVLPVRDGWEVLKQLKASPDTADIPVLIVSVVPDHELGMALGADDYFLKPLDRRRFLDRLRGLAAPAGARRPCALVIDDDPLVHDYLGLELESAGYEVLAAEDGRTGIDLAIGRRPDVVVLDLVMEGIDGFRVGAELQTNPATAAIPIIVFTSKELAADERRELARRMSAVLSKAPDDRHRLVALLRDLQARQAARKEPDAARLGDRG
jgi:signal transduction histidine kinase/CheY-like chemotaxis protein